MSAALTAPTAAPVHAPSPAPTAPPSAAAPAVWPRPLRWTCDLFHTLGDSGILEGRNVFLVNGEITEMAPPGPPHNMAVSLTDYWLKSIFTPGHVVRVQTGLVLGLSTNPAPDLAVVVGSPRDYRTHPRTAVLVVEVADSSPAYDRTEKASLYAAAGITDYWVLDVVNSRLEIFRDPPPDPALPFGAGYARVTAHEPADVAAPLAKPTARVTAAELLP